MIQITDLEVRRASLVDELEKIDSVLAAVRSYALAYAPSLLGEQIRTTQTRTVREKSPQKSSDNAERRVTITDRTADAAWEAIVEAGAPISLSAILEAVTKAGVPMGNSENPRNVLGARLHNSKRFESTPQGWWLKDEPLPTANGEHRFSNKEGALNGHTVSAPLFSSQEGGDRDATATTGLHKLA